MPPAIPDWQPVLAVTCVFRFVKDGDPSAEGFADNFKSDAERDKAPAHDEHPDLLTGMSAFASEAKARERWAQIRKQALKKRSERK